MNDLLNLTFENQPVRIVTRGVDPWFVAADILPVLSGVEA